MRSRWGSCSSSGRISLNLLLIQAAPLLIDYVILHELAHLLEHNHGPGFQALMTALLPDWKKRRAELRHLAALLLAGPV
jgi:predicted metal-dependent hydrolase